MAINYLLCIFFSVCLPGFSLAGESRRPHDLRDGVVRLPGHPRRLCLRPHLQKLRRREMEDERSTYLDAQPRVSQPQSTLPLTLHLAAIIFRDGTFFFLDTSEG